MSPNHAVRVRRTARAAVRFTELIAIALLFAVAAAAFFARRAHAQVPQTAYTSTTFTLADSLATNVAALTATSGIRLNAANAVAGTFCVESTRTITAGTMRAYVYAPLTLNNDKTPATFAWVPYAALDWTLSTGNRCSASGDKVSYTGAGRLVWLPDAVTASGGTTGVSILQTRSPR